jgi:hypothetical protein
LSTRFLRFAAFAAAANGFAATGGPKPSAVAGAAPGSASSAVGETRARSMGASMEPHARFPTETTEALDGRIEGGVRSISFGGGAARVAARGEAVELSGAGKSRGGVRRAARAVSACVCGFDARVVGLGGANDMRRGAPSATRGARARGVATVAGDSPASARGAAVGARTVVVGVR